MAKTIQYISLLLLVMSICTASDNTSPLTHKEVLRRLTDEIVTTAVVDDSKLSSTTLVIRTGPSFSQFITPSLTQVLLERHNRIFVEPATHDTVVRCEIGTMTLHYGEPFVESLFSSRKIKRTISISIDFSVSLQETGEILFSKNYSKQSVDTLYFSAIDRYNDPHIPFSTVQQPTLSFFDTLLEPAIITVASAVAIYLFFTIRS